MVKVLKTNLGLYIALPDSVTLSPDEVRAYKEQTYNNPKVHERFEFKEAFPKADAALTKALMTELTRSVPEIKKTVNELADDSSFRKRVLEIDQRTGRQHCYTHYTISASDLPTDYSSCPVPLLRKEEYYFPKYDSKKQKYICCDEYGHEIKINSTRASFDFQKMEVVVYDKAFFFTPQEAETIKKLNQLSRQQPDLLKQQPQQALALYAFYLDISQHYLNKNQKLYSVSHELQHAQTQQRINQRRQALNYVELSPTNAYRFDEDNEKAAHLRETYLAIAKFFQKDGDISVFPQKCQWLVNKIKNLSFEKQKQILLNHNLIVNGNIQNWNKNYAEHYIGQRFSLARDHAYDASVLRMEDGEQEYLARRSCAYTMDVYNPQTGKMEKQDLSKFIQIPTVVREEELPNVAICEQIRRQRSDTLKQNGIDRKLILSLFNQTYQEPFNSPSSQLLRDQIFKRGISFKSKNMKGEPVLIKVKKESYPNRPNCMSITSSAEGKQIFHFILDRDKQEYTCLFKNSQKYSNATGTRHQPLPEQALKQIKKYMAEASNVVTLQIQKISQGKDPKE